MITRNKKLSGKALTEKCVFAGLSISTLIVVAPVVLILYFLLQKGAPAMSWSFLTKMPEHHMRAGGIFPAIIGTFYLLTGTVLFAVPIGVLAAIYLTEYAPKNTFTKLIRLAIVNLAGVPSIVFGLFGFACFVILLNFDAPILIGSFTLALMVLPVIITSSEEALLTVPQSFRDGSMALGATKWQTIWRIVLPNSMAGIITGVILGVSRAAGETAPIMFVAAYYMKHLPNSPFDKFMALPYHLYVLTQEGFGIPESSKWGTALTLLILVLGMNLIAAMVRGRFRRSRTW